MCGAIPPLTQYVFMACCLVKQRDNFIFLQNYLDELKMEIALTKISE
jgi:hypothetical protein